MYYSRDVGEKFMRRLQKQERCLYTASHCYPNWEIWVQCSQTEILDALGITNSQSIPWTPPPPRPRPTISAKPLTPVSPTQALDYLKGIGTPAGAGITYQRDDGQRGKHWRNPDKRRNPGVTGDGWQLRRFDPVDPASAEAVATQDIRDDTDLLKGRINLNKATLGRNDEYLLTNSLLRNNALVMTLGGKGRATKGLTQHHRQDGPQAEITLNSKSFYDNFLPECHDIFNKIKAEEIANAELPYCRQNNWLLEPLVVRIMADCYGQIKRTNADQGALAEYISSMNVDRNDPKNDIVSLELIDPEKSRLYPRNKDAWTLAANQIIKAATG